MITYKDAGVDVERGYEAVRRMKQHVAATFDENVLGGLGSFGGFYSIENENVEKPVLVAGTDGVGTKLKLAFLMDKHDTVGIDCVAMCVNDIICCGARPVFFLDYIACGKNVPEKIAAIVSGVAEGCVQSECALVGGETAEHPGLMDPNEYDLAGFAVGIADRSRIIDKNRTRSGDVLIALPSSGLHSNGFSLVRRVFDVTNEDLTLPIAELGGKSLGEVLLTPTRIYVKPILALLDEVQVHGISHITGGGFYENIPRALPAGLCAKIDRASLRIPPIFTLLQKAGNIDERDMFNTYNMGVGMCVTAAKEDAEKALSILRANGEDAYVLGEVVEGDGVVIE